MIRLLLSLLLFTASTPSASAASEAGLRWFQIEISVFTNEFPEDRNSEDWSPERARLNYPPRLKQFTEVYDLLRIENFEQNVLGLEINTFDPLAANDLEPVQTSPEQQYLTRIAPKPFTDRGLFRLPDLDRDPYLLLPEAMSDFQTSNTRIDRSPNNRLLYHALWRQPMQDASNATPLLVLGGDRYGEHFELEGSVILHYNEGADRIVVDANLWLTDFTRSPVGDEAWLLPALPVVLETDPFDVGSFDIVSPDIASSDNPTELVLTPQEEVFNIRRIIKVQQSREMRSNEFHYLDHPALGLVISVVPYELPPPIEMNQVIP